MRYWYKFSDADKWENCFIEGKDFKVPVYEETQDILDDFYNNEFSEWWQIKRWGKDDYEFDNEQDAWSDLMADLGDSLFCKLNDC